MRLPVAILAVLTLSATAQQPAPVDHVVVTKSTHTLVLYSHGTVVRTYKVALGPASGPKRVQGDNKTPEGHYLIDNHNPNSAYHLSLHISYPNPTDRANAARNHQKTGGDIMIHGLPPAWRYVGAMRTKVDWTAGCIAVTDPEIEEIYKLVPNGTPIDILP